ncbi:ABC transporter, ATP-binding protein [Desulfitobacterium hafniense DP7]|uniref:ABC transporter, ATP-binding protein n=1 Tax=Desulfitobacterium hafniense DP7 TaxID=537010 RepID=G9XGW6_DESHA|nr:ATP-binding cassette domain-containing protein [Desulfitobacterium hafniense]EHL09151.1 ABC transporter, ATP-binding protein [Desulfitobacterium hafniense DP7]
MLLEGKNICFRYGQEPWLLQDINLQLEEGERVGLIGPSGCGKSTLAKILSGYLKPIRGEVLLAGKPLPEKGYCPVQLIYQHPEKSLNPRWKLGASLAEGWEPDDQTLEELGIEREWLKRYPNELSGGELQRFCIARVLGHPTRFILADEISTMLDVITQAQIWDVLLKIIKERNMGLLTVTHNRALAEKICTRLIHFEDL